MITNIGMDFESKEVRYLDPHNVLHELEYLVCTNLYQNELGTVRKVITYELPEDADHVRHIMASLGKTYLDIEVSEVNEEQDNLLLNAVLFTDRGKMIHDPLWVDFDELICVDVE